jgi:hypothetical protein
LITLSGYHRDMRGHRHTLAMAAAGALCVALAGCAAQTSVSSISTAASAASAASAAGQ